MSASPVVLVVDDAPQSLGALCVSLEAEGYTVLVARDGESALARLDLATPDAILLDALMPGLSGFETCRRIKQDPALSHIPVIFMTGLSETPHIVEGFESGGVDYVVKPVRAQEVLVRLATHVRNARAVRLAREAVDVGGHGVLVLDARGRVAWRSPQAAAWLREFHPDGLPPAWAGDGPLEHRSAAVDGRVLAVRHAGAVGLGECMLLLRVQAASDALPTRLSTASLTPRETEVLSWIAKGKTNRDVGEILGMSPRTVNKHLEHVFEKLGVETRAAAAALASRELG
ncbi:MULTISPECIES: response regulator transcription factor [unclassified Rhizobacter]|uniref:response regulator transcription factor n=1 Tax=unclassified Rhizobacter TaxID=2640088 RepID=UPI0006FC0E08|nr:MULTISPECIES: response regulator transcription factor [unclassified Rhizobacter]KQU76886.1 LuxR family transcriptional regulator [Rhizobacter sp. Root29]KQV97407.1 LuxR family transcriptional regulator [Rhizobacter sp. Root1238]KRB10078.1 LuxR family transcriptional regulator [Rhizobacter sp. Root16D2]